MQVEMDVAPSCLHRMKPVADATSPMKGDAGQGGIVQVSIKPTNKGLYFPVGTTTGTSQQLLGLLSGTKAGRVMVSAQAHTVRQARTSGRHLICSRMKMQRLNSLHSSSQLMMQVYVPPQGSYTSRKSGAIMASCTYSPCPCPCLASTASPSYAVSWPVEHGLCMPKRECDAAMMHKTGP